MPYPYAVRLSIERYRRTTAQCVAVGYLLPIGEREIGNQVYVSISLSGCVWFVCRWCDFGFRFRDAFIRGGSLELLCRVGWVGGWSGAVSRRGARVGVKGGDDSVLRGGMSFSDDPPGRSDGGINGRGLPVLEFGRGFGMFCELCWTRDCSGEICCFLVVIFLPSLPLFLLGSWYPNRLTCFSLFRRAR